MRTLLIHEGVSQSISLATLGYDASATQSRVDQSGFSFFPPSCSDALIYEL
jgi:hypothetical protein